MSIRDTNGRFLRGTSGNIKGRPNNKGADFKNILREHEEISLQTILDLMENKSGNVSCSTRLKAVIFVLEQLHGKARQRVDNVQNDFTDIEHMSTPELLKSINQLKLEIEEDKKKLSAYSDWERNNEKS